MNKLNVQRLALRPKRALPLWAVLVLVLITASFTSVTKVKAAELVQRRIVIGTSVAGSVTSHTIRFTTQTSTSVGSIVLEYCTNLPFYDSPCNQPAGLIINNATIASQSGVTGLSVNAGQSTVNRLVLSRTASIVNGTLAQISLNNITNQSSSNQSVYVRISVKNATDGTGTPVDFGAVVYSTADGVGVGGYVPPYLTFCVGITVALECTTTSGFIMNLGEMSPLYTSSSTSQFAAATNDPTGYNVYMNGDTVTSGNEVIPNLTSNTSSSIGTSQFGINLRSNSSPLSGADVSGIGTGVPTANYDTPNSYRYVSGEMIARSAFPTLYNRYTVSYMVNVSDDQKPGVYAASFTFTAVASF